MLWYPSFRRHAIWFLDSVGTCHPLPSAINSFSPALRSCRHMPWHLSECHPLVDCPLLWPLLDQDVWFLSAMTCLSPPLLIISSHPIELPQFVGYIQDQGSGLARSASFIKTIASHNMTYHPKARWSRHWHWALHVVLVIERGTRHFSPEGRRTKLGMSGSWQIMESFLYVLVTLEKGCRLRILLEFKNKSK